MLLSSCYCCGLRDGALAVAITFLSMSVVDLLAVLIGWGYADAKWAYISQVHPDIDFGFPDAEILAPLTIFVLVQLIFDALLLLGVHLSPTRPSNARRHLLSWIIFRGVVTGLITLGSFALLITAIVYRYDYGHPIDIMISVEFGVGFVVFLVASGLFWFGWVVVLSFYMQVRTTEVPGVIYNRMGANSDSAGTGGEAERPAVSPQTAAQATGGQEAGQRWA